MLTVVIKNRETGEDVSFEEYARQHGFRFHPTFSVEFFDDGRVDFVGRDDGYTNRDSFDKKRFKLTITNN